MQLCNNPSKHEIIAQYAGAYFVFLYHWQEESQHAILDEIEWVRHDAGLRAEQRDSAVDEFIALVAAVDSILQARPKADGSYFTTTCGRTVHEAEARAIETRISQGLPLAIHLFRRQHPHFDKVLSSLINEKQDQRIQQQALATLQ